MRIELGCFIQQSTGYTAFVPCAFPPKQYIDISATTQQLHSFAMFALGKLDGITQLLPDLDFFLFMYVRKEAALSSQIEGIRATIVDVIAAESISRIDMSSDVDDILHYIKALNYGLKRLKKFPLSLRFIREVHKVLMKDSRSTQFSNPGEFRRSQNWISGATPKTATFVPPPVHEMYTALGDFEKFLHTSDDLLPLVKTALMHSQFETIKPS